MNYIWDLVIKAKNSGLLKKDIYFSPAKVFSPYMELSLKYINTQEVTSEVEINPYYSYYKIFRDLVNSNNSEDMELKNTLFDILVHFLADIALRQGLNKRDYYLKFLLKDIESGLFGKENRERIEFFDQGEKEILVGNILKLYEMGEAIYLFKNTMRKIFEKFIIYVNPEEKDELVIYIDQEENKAAEAKLELIKDFFVPIKLHTETYWKNHFGLIGFEETMLVDSIALY